MQTWFVDFFLIQQQFDYAWKKGAMLGIDNNVRAAAQCWHKYDRASWRVMILLSGNKGQVSAV